MEKSDVKILLSIIAVLSVFYLIPKGSVWFESSFLSGISMLQDYARLHVITCLIPALFIAGAISVFIKKESVLKYLGSRSKKPLAYAFASISGAILAVCSCTILPIFAGIRKRGAGLGPAVTFLFSGPAINIAAMFLTISVLGAKIGAARIIFSIAISIIVGITMALIFRENKDAGEIFLEKGKEIPLKKSVLIPFFLSLVLILVVNGLQIGKTLKYSIIAFLVIFITLISSFKFRKETRNEWINESWGFAKTILPILFFGVFIAGFLMPLIPEKLIENLVGGDTLIGNLTASVFGAFMYFSTLTEIPIMQALIAKGMANGPALALLLSGPALSLPSMLALQKIMGARKTSVYVLLVIAYSTAAGLIFGMI
ncbi:MAG: permease [Candidatus Woesearchaeota archaeon]|nr:permease [Candidatus Woesearchaeota archaeon]